ncbi:MAG: proline--tRNA ligase [Candidatus Firestonebacteria bacterium]|nr:proline--tRNA ligase [Candidatus Firestonebacteria bacterium]
MRMSQYLIPTLREEPKEAQVISHKLMLRAGYIRKVASGIYSYLPLGKRVLTKIENIVREEMNKKNGQEVLLPVLSPRELWDESGRWEVYGKELMRISDRNDHFFALGPTHEEVITDLVRNEIRSYKQLPLLFYQIQTKFRDEIRPRFGVMRGREFCMKDAYSFHSNEESLEKTYKDMYDAYSNIFRRCGLLFRVVEADTGAIGGACSHEFMVQADSGEDAVVFCENCGYSANMEKAVSKKKNNFLEEKLVNIQKISTPGIKSIDDLSIFIGVKPEKIIKTLFYNTDKGEVAVLIRGDYDINEVKLKNYMQSNELYLSDEETVKRFSGAEVGFAGPLGLKNIRILADYSLEGCVNMIAGANETDYHYVNVNFGRDFNINDYIDIRILKETDEICINCNQELKICRGIEVGHIFKLGKKYSQSMKATFSDENGEEKIYIMGCYGIGVSRTMAAAIEQNNDENGIIWPISIAPFHAEIVPTNTGDEKIRTSAFKIYQSLTSLGIETLIDDREERPGVKFKDADLIGIPLRITLGKNFTEADKIEIKIRRTGKIVISDIKEVCTIVKNLIKDMMDQECNQLEA